MRYFIPIAFFALLSPLSACAQELVPDRELILSARVLEIVREEQLPIEGTDVSALNQTIRAEILDEPKKRSGRRD